MPKYLGAKVPKVVRKKGYFFKAICKKKFFNHIRNLRSCKLMCSYVSYMV